MGGLFPEPERKSVGPSVGDSARKLARRHDPATSKAGAVDAALSLAKLQRDALEIVKRHPGMTSTEMADAEGMFDPRKINRRLGELETLGLVDRCEPRPCKITGRLAATWKPAE
jgi:hypothetical protein